MNAMPPPFQVTQRDQFDRLIAHAATMGFPGAVELLRSARAGEIDLVQIERAAAAPIRLMEKSTRPVVCVIGDDDDASTGPAGWHATRRLLWWAKAAMVHATGADAESYQVAIAMALASRRFLLIETDTAHMREWGDVLLKRRIPFLGLRPADGGVHPIPPDRAAMQ